MEPVMMRKASLRLLLQSGTASVALALASPAAGQSFAGSRDTVVGTSEILPIANGMEIRVFSPITVINWFPSDQTGTGPINFQPANTTADFVFLGPAGPPQDFTVLNRILPTNIMQMPVNDRQVQLNGNIESHYSDGQIRTTAGRLWFYTPGGLLVGERGSFDVGSLVLTTSDPYNSTSVSGGAFSGPSGTINFQNSLTANAVIVVSDGARINAASNGSYVALFAPRVQQGGNVFVNGSAAYVGAETGSITINNGLFDIGITSGTSDANGVVHTGNTTGPQRTSATDRQSIVMVAIPKNTALTMLLGGTAGFPVVNGATLEGGAVILSAGHDVAIDGPFSAPNPNGSAPANILLDGLNGSALADSYQSTLGVIANGELTSRGLTRAGRDILAFASSDIKLGDVRASRDFTLRTTGDVLAEHLEARRNFTVVSANRFETGLNSIIAGGDISITTTGDALLGNSTAGGFIEVNAGGVINFNNLESGSSTTLVAQRNITGLQTVTDPKLAISVSDFGARAQTGIDIGTVRTQGSAFFSTASGLLNVGSSTATGDINYRVRGTGNIVAGSTTAGGDIFANAPGNITLTTANANGGFVNGSGDVAIGNIFTISGGDTSFGNATAAAMIGARANSISATGTLTAAEDILLIASGTANVLGASAGDDIDVSALTSSVLTNGSALATARDDRRINFEPIGFFATAGAGSGPFFEVVAAPSDGSDIRIRTDGASTSTSLTAGEDVLINAGGAVTASGLTRAGRDIIIDRSGSMDLGDVRALRDITLTSDGNIVAVHSEADRNFTVTDANRFETGLNSIITGGDIDITTLGDALLGNSTAGGFIRVSAGGLIDFNSLDSGSNTNLVAGQTITGLQTISNRTLTTSDFTANAQTGIDIGTVQTRASASLTTNTGLLNVGTVTATGDVTYRARTAGEIVAGNSTAGGDIFANAPGSITLTTANANGGFVNGNGSPSIGNIFTISGRDTSFGDANAATMIGASAANITATGTLTAGEDILLRASGAVNVNSASAGDDVDVFAPTASTLTTGVARATAPDDRQINFNSGTGPIAIMTGPFFEILAAPTDGSDIRITTDGASTSANLTAGDDVIIRAGGAANVSGLSRTRGVGITGGSSDIDIVAATAALTNNDASTNLIVTTTGDSQIGNALAGGFIRATSGGVLGFGSIQSGSRTTLTTARTVTGTQTVAGADIQVFAGGDVTIGSAAANGTFLDPTTGVAVDGNIFVRIANPTFTNPPPGSLSLNTAFARNMIGVSALDVRGTGSWNAGEDILVRGNGAVDLASLTAGNDIDVRAPGNVSITNATATGLGVDTRVVLFGPSPIFSVQTAPGDGGDIIINSGADIATTTLNAADDISLTATGRVSVSGLAQTRGLGTIGGSSDITVNAASTALGTNDAFTDFLVTTTGAAGLGSATAGRLINVTGASSSYTDLRSGTSTSVVVTGDITGGNADAGTQLFLSGASVSSGTGRGADIRYVSTVGGITSGALTSTAGPISIEANTANTTAGLNITGPVNAATYAELRAGGPINMGTFTAGTDAIASAFNGSSVTTGDVTAGDDVWVSAFGTNPSAIVTTGALRSTGLGSDTATSGPATFGGPGPTGNVIRVRSSGSVNTGTVTTPGRAFLVGDLGSVSSGLITAPEVVAVLARGNVTLAGANTSGQFYVADSSLFLPNVPPAYAANALDTVAPVPLTGNVSITAPVTARDAVIAATGSVTTADLTVSDDIRITSGGVANLGALSANGPGADNEGDGANVIVNGTASVATAAVNARSNIVITGTSVTTGNGTAGSAVNLQATTGAVQSGNLSSGIGTTVAAATTVNGSDIVATTGNVAVNAGGDVTTGALTANAGNVTISTAVGNVTTGQITTRDDFSLNIAGSANLAGVAVGDDIRVNTGGSATFGTLTTATSGADSEGDGRNAIITAGGAFSVGQAQVVQGQLRATALQAVTASNATATGPITLTSRASDVTVTGLTSTAAGIEIFAARDAILGGANTSNTTLDVQATRLASITGISAAPTIAVRSDDIALSPTARLGTIGTTRQTELTNLTGNQMTVGGAGVATGYSLSGAELQRVFSDNITVNWVNGPNAGAANPNIVIDSFNLSSRATNAQGNLGASGTLAVNAPGLIRVTGAAQLTGAGANNSLRINSGTSVEVISGQGTLSVVDGGGALTGLLGISAPSIFAATPAAIAAIPGLGTLDAINTRLGQNDGVGSAQGFLRAGTITLRATDGIFVQNTGTGPLFANRAGFSTGAGGLNLLLSNANGRIVVNGRIGTTNGLDAIPLISINGVLSQTAIGYDRLSTANGCIITGVALCRAQENPTSFNSSSIGGPASGSVLGVNLPPNTLVELKEFKPFGFPPLIDEPVTGAGNDDLWQKGCSADDSDC
jgi:hypothetical protein